jgi:hypothetical protein
MAYPCIGKCGASVDVLPAVTPFGVPWKESWGYLCPPCANQPVLTTSGVPKRTREQIAEDENAVDAYNELLGADDK